MDLNLWNDDFFLPQDMGLDLLADLTDGQYGDLKELGHLDGDLKPNQHEDVIEQLSLPSGQDTLDINWMESDITDIGSWLNALATQQEFSFSPDLFDVTSSFPTDIGVKDNTPVFQLTVSNDIQNGHANLQTCAQDSVLTPPESPDQQVQPEIKLEETWSISDDLSPASLADESNFSLPENGQVFQESLDLKNICLFGETSQTELQNSVDFLGSPLSADEVKNVLSSPEPASPSASSLIQSSPELYKVIAAPSNLTRFSPYSKQKDEQKSKSSKSRAKKNKPTVLSLPEEASNLSKKDRKKLQNKNAAIRYRQKKREEAKEVVSEVQGLEDRNQELKTKVEDLEREIRYMKNLMQDIQRAKGLIQ